MKARGCTSADITNNLKFDRSYVSRALHDKIGVPKKLVKALSSYLKVSEAWLMTGEGNPEEGVQGGSYYSVTNTSSSEKNPPLFIETTNNADIQCFTGIRDDLIGSTDLIVTSKTHDNGSGEYLCVYNGKTCIIFRLNSETKTLWKKKSFDEQPPINPEKLEIIGKVIAVISPTVSSIEQTSHRFYR